MILSTRSVSGTSFHSDVFVECYKNICKVFKPQFCENLGSDKVNMEWIFEFKDHNYNEIIVFTLYDWKEYRKIKPFDKIEWHIGAYSKTDSEKALFQLNNYFNNEL